MERVATPRPTPCGNVASSPTSEQGTHAQAAPQASLATRSARPTPEARSAPHGTTSEAQWHATERVASPRPTPCGNVTSSPISEQGGTRTLTLQASLATRGVRPTLAPPPACARNDFQAQPERWDALTPAPLPVEMSPPSSSPNKGHTHLRPQASPATRGSAQDAVGCPPEAICMRRKDSTLRLSERQAFVSQRDAACGTPFWEGLGREIFAVSGRRGGVAT
jgi:hypothetical protein